MKDKTWDLIDILEKKYKIQFLKERGQYVVTMTGDVLADSKSGVLAKDGLPLFDYYNEGDNYVGGVHFELNDFMEKQGFKHDWWKADEIIGFF
jgi:hypothetical protein